MSELLQNSVFFGVFISLASYFLGTELRNRFKLAIFNPLLIATVIIVIILTVLDIPYESYNNGASNLSFLLTPATVCLAVPLHEQFQLLKKNYKAVLVGILTGVLTSMLSVLLLCWVFNMGHTAYITLLPKSITTAIGMGVSQELGGYVSVTVAVIITTGILGNMIAEHVCKWFHITEPIAKGVAVGTASHAIGTTKAMKMGQTEGAMSSLSMVVSGILTVVCVSVFANFL